MHGAAGEGGSDQLLGEFVLGRFVVVEEEDADDEPVLGLEVLRLVELEALGLLLEEVLRDLAGQAGAVARVGANAAAVFEGLEGDDGFFHDFRGRFAVFGGHGANSAGISAHVIRIEQLSGTNQRQSLIHRPVSFAIDEKDPVKPGDPAAVGLQTSIVLATPGPFHKQLGMIPGEHHRAASKSNPFLMTFSRLSG